MQVIFITIITSNNICIFQYFFQITFCESEEMSDMFRAGRSKGMSAFKRLHTKEVRVGLWKGLPTRQQPPELR